MNRTALYFATNCIALQNILHLKAYCAARDIALKGNIALQDILYTKEYCRKDCSAQWLTHSGGLIRFGFCTGQPALATVTY